MRGLDDKHNGRFTSSLTDGSVKLDTLPTPKKIFPTNIAMKVVKANLAPTPFLFLPLCMMSRLKSKLSSVPKPTCFHSSSLTSSCHETPRESRSSLSFGTIAGGRFRRSLEKNPSHESENKRQSLCQLEMN
jgi:hypothetical protein